ncbi:MAG: DNA alkylation repair protein [Candidatus Aenigmatarchaeota archaeon]
MFEQVKRDLEKLSNPDKAGLYQKFFKIGKGQYEEGDVFIGLSVPEQRSIAKKYIDISFDDVKKLIKSEIHEHRLTGFLILVQKFEKANKAEKREIVHFYLTHTKHVNNWDLVDLSASRILGTYLLDKDRRVLYGLAKSDNLWERRISIVSTYAFIINHQFDDTIKISRLLLRDSHDLIHKAVGWMLREVGKKDLAKEEEFLKKHYKEMPRTMLRYAIEKFPERKRKHYMRK